MRSGMNPLGCLIPCVQVLGASSLHCIGGVGLLVWVFCGYMGILGYLAQAPWTTPGH